MRILQYKTISKIFLMRYTLPMSTRFVSADRNQPLLLPPDLRDWIPEEDLVHFVIQAVEGMSLDAFKSRVRGALADLAGARNR